MSASYGTISHVRPRTRTISVTSGKGGVGKTTLLANLAVQFARLGKRVLILDGDLGMANVDVMFGVRAKKSLLSVLNGDASMADIVIELAQNIRLIPGGSGVSELLHLQPVERQFVLDQVSQIDWPVDILLIDTASGIDENVLSLNAAAEEAVVVLTPDPSSMTDAYALIKVMNQRFGENRFSVVANMVANEAEALRLYGRLSEVAQNFLNVSLQYRGFVTADAEVSRSTKAQQLVTREAPQSLASQQILGIAEDLKSDSGTGRAKGGMQFFWERLVSQAS
jgi:flagellar biosynthesis protein FlhG